MTQKTGITRRLGWLVTRKTTIKRMTALSGITGVTKKTLTRFCPSQATQSTKVFRLIPVKKAKNNNEKPLHTLNETVILFLMSSL